MTMAEDKRAASKPLRPCRAPGCCVLVKDGYCQKHKKLEQRAKARKASGEWHWMYDTDEWKEDLRPEQLLREPFCRECAKLGLRVRATVVDHVIPHEGDWNLFCDRGNLQSLCKNHHDAKTARERNEKRKGKGRR